MRYPVFVSLLSIVLIGGIYATDTLESSLLLKGPVLKSTTVMSAGKNPITLTYKSDTKIVSDSITLSQKGRKSKNIPGPISQYSKEKKAEVSKCLVANNSNCLESYSLGSISPGNKYFEMHMQGFQKEAWSIRSLSSGKVLYANDTGIQDSAWSADGKEIVWVTTPCILRTCSSKSGVYFGKIEGLSKAIKIANINEYGLGYKVMLDTENIYVLEKKTRTINTLRVYDRRNGTLKQTL